MKTDKEYKENFIVKYAIYIELFFFLSIIFLLSICKINHISILNIIIKLFFN